MKILLTLIFSCLFLFTFAQINSNPIVTAVPFMNMESDARTIGFGEIGAVATLNNYSSAAFQNPALYGKGDYQFGIVSNLLVQEFSYSLFSVFSNNIFFKVGKNAFALHSRYFDWDDFMFTDENGNPLPEGNTDEWNEL